MRILHLCSHYPMEELPPEGAFFRNMTEPLADLGEEVAVVTPLPFIPMLPKGISARIPLLRRAARLPQACERHGVKIVLPRFPYLPHKIGQDLLPILLAETIKGAVPWIPDVVHTHYAYPWGRVALRLQSLWKAPIVLTLHGADTNSNPFQSKRGLRRFVEAVRGVDHVLAVSDDLASIAYRLTGRVVESRPIGVDLRGFREASETKSCIRRQLGLPEDKKLMLLVGSLIKRKGIDVLAAALQVLRSDIHCVVIGDGPLRHLVDNLTNCTWLRSVSNYAIVQYLNASDIMILPTRSEGMPTVLAEAGAAGLPVVASAVSGIPSLLAEDRGILIKPNDVESLVKGIYDAVDHPEQSRQRAARLRAYVLQHYDREMNARKLRDLYTSLVASSKSLVNASR